MARPEFIPEHGFGTIARHEFQEVAAPDPVPYGFETWGWAVVFGLGLLLFAYAVVRLVIWFKQNQYRRDAVAAFRALDSEAVADAAIVLKRTAIEAFGRPNVAALSGVEWADFLNARCDATQFTAEVFDTLMYRGPERLAPGDKQAFMNNVETWIRRHHA